MTRFQGTVIIVTLMSIMINVTIMGLRLGVVNDNLKELVKIERMK